MGEARRKAMTRPDISVLIPVRGRPQETAECIRSLLARAAGDPRIEILLAVDHDDDAGHGWYPALYNTEPRLQDPRVHAWLWDRPPTLGDKLNRLAKEAKGDILWFLANDYMMHTEGWPDIFREAVRRNPNGLGVPYPRDALHPDHSAFPILTRKMCEAVGYFMAPWFPYWFVDTWWDEIGILTDTRREILCEVAHQGERGKSHGLIDLTFWAGVFEETRPMRARDALILAKLAWGEDSDNFAAVANQLNQRSALCAQRVAHLRHPGFVEHWEGQAASPPSPQYPEVKAKAEALVAQLRKGRPKRLRVGLCVPSTDVWKAPTAVDIAGLSAISSMHGIEIAIINLQGSMISQERNSIAETALRENCDYLFWIDSDMSFPPDALVRLIAHDKDIVGATYNKKSEPFETLGRFAGPKPEKMGDLHEALLLPGGMLLVKAEVYRKMKFPMYFESYHWAGADGWESFCEMMRNYLYYDPPPEALEGIKDSAFGKWIKDHFLVGEGQKALYFSEDLSWCRKARRAGYKIWCDLRLTFECKHIGQLTVTCLAPEQAAPAAAAE